MVGCCGRDRDAVRAPALQRRHISSLSGREWVTTLLAGHNDVFAEQMGMAKHVFRKLLRVLYTKAHLKSTRYVDLEEQLAIFLYTTVTGLSN
ncbi:hypothetical protein BD410DRAFT_867664 [Rickenella mellea]|uniref:DUF8040 domain-containing protein n=1 Tax=Rickenella mellea TaxID=50990 RepID=A0A4Y7PFB6_9AGAM|nr:hypothetical protein BD410DRAFT_867664 [Rickenella mellea]